MGWKGGRKEVEEMDAANSSPAPSFVRLQRRGHTEMEEEDEEGKEEEEAKKIHPLLQLLVSSSHPDSGRSI